ncbi:MAG: hypothetical protein EU530_05470 [Promethearchaeota archaeon]|nr:MAG: hypothetical protein EU530_05470 [Candidatus Lokiarchaeota archaeon]
MNFGRLLAVLGGLITLVGTWWFSLFISPVIAGAPVYSIGGILNFSWLVGNGAAVLGVDNWVVYLILVVYSMYLLSFIAQLAGGKSRISAFIGSLLPLAVGVIIMIFSLTGGSTLGTVVNAIGLFAGDPIIVGWFPFHYSVGVQFEALGTYAIIFGSLLALISSFIPRPDDY